jgi:hypothetical protein
MLMPALLSAQNTSQVRILSSSSLSQESINGEAVQKIINAEVSAENFRILADSAIKFVNRNEFRAFGNIEIDTEGKRIWADSLYYFTDIDYSRLRGRVIIATDSSTIYSNAVDYLFALEIARFLDFVRLEDKNGFLTAREGDYFQKQDSAVFRLNVQLQDSAQYARGDSLLINRTSERFEFFGNVFAADSVNNTVFTSQYMSGDSTGNRSLKGDAYLRNVSSDSAASDTTHINAEIIRVRKDSTYRITEAIKSVQIWSPEFSAVADSSILNDKLERVELFIDPKVWYDNVQLSGDYIRVDFDSSAIRELNAYPKPFAVSEDSASGRLNQITGDSLRADFKEGNLSTISVFPTNAVLFHSTNEAGEADGAIEFNALERTVLYFSEAGIDSVVSVKSVDGIYIPEFDELPDRKLEGFIWTPQLRPDRPKKQLPGPADAVLPEVPFSLPFRFQAYQKNKRN